MKTFSKHEIIRLINLDSSDIQLIDKKNSKYSEETTDIFVRETFVENFIFCKLCKTKILKSNRSTSMIIFHFKKVQNIIKKDDSSVKNSINNSAISSFFKRPITENEKLKIKQILTNLIYSCYLQLVVRDSVNFEF